jgi:hypothetical protein
LHKELPLLSGGRFGLFENLANNAASFFSRLSSLFIGFSLTNSMGAKKDAEIIRDVANY